MRVYTDAPVASLSHMIVLQINSETKLFKKIECGAVTLAEDQTPIQPLSNSSASTAHGKKTG